MYTRVKRQHLGPSLMYFWCISQLIVGIEWKIHKTYYFWSRVHKNFLQDFSKSVLDSAAYLFCFLFFPRYKSGERSLSQLKQSQRFRLWYRCKACLKCNCFAPNKYLPVYFFWILPLPRDSLYLFMYSGRQVDIWVQNEMKKSELEYNYNNSRYLRWLRLSARGGGKLIKMFVWHPYMFTAICLFSFYFDNFSTFCGRLGHVGDKWVMVPMKGQRKWAMALRR